MYHTYFENEGSEGKRGVMANDTVRTTCCVVGGGPAGIMLGYLLAREGVPVTVLEKHKDFFRDFRGDTVHPSTLELMFELGLLQDFLKMPHQELTQFSGMYGDYRFTAANVRHVPTRSKFVALMPQWDFLAFLSGAAKKFPAFDLRMEHEAVGLIEEGGRVTGVRVRTPEGAAQVSADLIVGCDGRHSMTKQAAGFQVREVGVPIDVLWFRVSRYETEAENVLGTIDYGKMLILINRGDYFQAGLLIEKGSFERLKREGLPAFRESVRKVAPFLGQRLDDIKEWDEIKLLSVQINRLRKWYRPGLLCIGDAAHAMSPVGGVGINLAIQDAVAAANLLAKALRERRVREPLLRRVQKRREFPTRVTQRLQRAVHALLRRVFRNKGKAKAPLSMKLIMALPGRQRLLGRLLAVGVRPEHVRTTTSSG